MSDETVTISRAQYEKLLRDSKVLSALEEGGVDNWDWYGEAISGIDDDD